MESKEKKRIEEKEREDEEEEEKKIDMFFKLIKNYQEARKRRREELAENSGDVRKKLNSGERSGIVVPAFQPEDFYQGRLDLKPSIMTVSDQKEENIKKEEDDDGGEARKEDNDLDLTLAL